MSTGNVKKLKGKESRKICAWYPANWHTGWLILLATLGGKKTGLTSLPSSHLANGQVF